MNKKYLTLAGRIDNELGELKKIKERIDRAWKKYNRENDEFYLDSVALNLHDYYSSLERIFEMVANEIDESIPQGASWQQEMVKQMTIKIKKVRPALISKEIEEKLDEYRGFRHIVRNVYTYNFSSEKIARLVDELDDLNNQFVEEIKIFIDFLEEVAETSD